MAGKKDWSEGLGAVVALFVTAFLLVAATLAILEQLGLPGDYVLWAMAGAPLIGYMALGSAARSGLINDFNTAGRAVPAVHNGMALAAQWITGVGFFALAGFLMELGHDGFVYVVGWSGGFVLIAALIAPYLHKSGAQTVPDFFGLRFGGAMPRLIGVLILAVASIGLLVAELQILGKAAEWTLGPSLPWLDYEIGLAIGLICLLLALQPGGMRSLSLVQIAQYAVVILGFLVPAIWLASAMRGMPVPHLALGDLLQSATALEREIGVAPGVQAVLGDAGPGDPVRDGVDFAAIVLCLMLGTAAMPHLLMRVLTTPTVREARRSVAWSMLFILLLVLTVPFYALIAEVALLRPFAGGGLAAEALPTWMQTLGARQGTEVIALCGVAPGDPAAVTAACGAEGIGLGAVRVSRVWAMLAAPELALMPWVVIGLMVAAGFAAALSSAGGLALSVSNAIAHDLHHRLTAPDATGPQRVTVAKGTAIAVLLLGGYLALTPPAEFGLLIGWSFSLFAGGLFPALVLGVWDRRTTGPGAAAGMVAGFGVALLYLVGATMGPDLAAGTGDELTLVGIPAVAAGVLGAPVGLVVIWLVSRLTPLPDAATEDFVESMRIPRAGAVVSDR